METTPDAPRVRDSSLTWGPGWSPPPGPSAVHTFQQPPASAKRAPKPQRRFPYSLRIAAAAAIAAGALLASRLVTGSRIGSTRDEVPALTAGADPEVVPDFFGDSAPIITTSGGSVGRAARSGARQSRGGSGGSTGARREAEARTKSAADSRSREESQKATRQPPSP